MRRTGLLMRAVVALGLWLAAAAVTPPLAAQEIEGPARAEIQRYLAQRGITRSLLRAFVFYGDFTGDGAADALAVVYSHIEGSASGFDITVATFRNEGGRFVHHRDHANVFGTSPSDVRFSPGRIQLTTKMPGPNDPRCCPTQTRRWTIATGTGGGPQASRAPEAPAAGSPAQVQPSQFFGRFTSERSCRNPETWIELGQNDLILSLGGDDIVSRIRFTGCEGAVCTLVATNNRRRWSVRLLSPQRIAIRGHIYDPRRVDRAEMMRCR